jgi:putative SOS response-associated peptidase YedK
VYIVKRLLGHTPKGKKKQAYAMTDDREMVMAGLWETWNLRTEQGHG